MGLLDLLVDETGPVAARRGSDGAHGTGGPSATRVEGARVRKGRFHDARPRRYKPPQVPDAKLQGWLKKQKRSPSSFGAWNRRFFALDMEHLELCWYKSRQAINPTGWPSLRGRALLGLAANCVQSVRFDGASSTCVAERQTIRLA